jgi:hypothetical protein
VIHVDDGINSPYPVYKYVADVQQTTGATATDGTLQAILVAGQVISTSFSSTDIVAFMGMIHLQ